MTSDVLSVWRTKWDGHKECVDDGIDSCRFTIAEQLYKILHRPLIVVREFGPFTVYKTNQIQPCD